MIFENSFKLHFERIVKYRAFIRLLIYYTTEELILQLHIDFKLEQYEPGGGAFAFFFWPDRGEFERLAGLFPPPPGFHHGEFDQNFSKMSNARGFGRKRRALLELTDALGPGPLELKGASYGKTK